MWICSQKTKQEGGEIMPRRNRDKFGKSYNAADAELKDYINFTLRRYK